jgi:SNF2 family DNA or RNA helicase
LSKLCRKKDIPFTIIVGGQNGSERQNAIDLFNNDASVRVCIANRKAGGAGINLCAASYSCVYSRNFSLTEEEQSKARNHRGGSEIHESIVKIDLVAKDTIDEHILSALLDKKNISEKIIDFIKDNDYIEASK